MSCPLLLVHGSVANHQPLHVPRQTRPSGPSLVLPWAPLGRCPPCDPPTRRRPVVRQAALCQWTRRRFPSLVPLAAVVVLVSVGLVVG
jgi:hypothetical protein